MVNQNFYSVILCHSKCSVPDALWCCYRYGWSHMRSLYAEVNMWFISLFSRFDRELYECRESIKVAI